MPNRIVRDAILTSEPVCSLGWAEEVFYRRLMSIVDDYGRHEASPQLLRSRCYPLQTDLVRVADISRWMAACQKAGLILVYEVAGKQYIQIERFGQQTRSASKHPQPPPVDSNCNQAPTDERLGVSVSVVVSEGEGDKPRKRGARTLKTSIPEGFGISDRVRAWAEKNNHDQLEWHLEHFRSKAVAKGYTYADWDEGFMGAIRDNWAKVEKTARVYNSAEETRRMLDEKNRGAKPPTLEQLADLAKLRKAA